VTAEPPADVRPDRHGVSRRALLSGAAVAAAGAIAGGGIVEAASGKSRHQPPATSAIPAFYGASQAGIATPPPAHQQLIAFDLSTTSRSELESLFKRWTSAGATLTAGQQLTGTTITSAPPPDTGETLGRPAASLTLTFGVGPGVFDARFGLRPKGPAGLAPIPAMKGDQLDPARSGGDLIVQACAEDPMVAFHAIRELANVARGAAEPRWSQSGFGATAAFHGTETPRNLFGQKDGTANPQPGTVDFGPTVWVQPGDDPAWMTGGSYLAVRRIRMDLAEWDITSAFHQDAALGRTKVTGAPLSGGSEFSAPDFGDRTSSGTTAIASDAHIRLANPAFTGGAEMLRRGYSYDDGLLPDGSRDAGLMFTAFVRDIPTQFTPVLASLTQHDAMHAFLTHTASAVFAILPGVPAGGFLGQTLLM
jgi:deferrochelatase/peroxidase EfeB